MKNREFYKEEILGILSEDGLLCDKFIKPKILASYGIDYNKIDCTSCNLLTSIWLEEEYEPPAEPEVDWTKVEVDTPILVSNDKENWEERHFAYVKNGTVYVWSSGRTSWTAVNTSNVWSWKYAKLAEKE